MKPLILAFILTAVALTTARAQNWPQFRGPGSTGVIEAQSQPVKFDAPKSENVRWKLAIPGLAHSSPIVWGDKIFVSTAITSAATPATIGAEYDVPPVET